MKVSSWVKRMAHLRDQKTGGVPGPSDWEWCMQAEARLWKAMLSLLSFCVPTCGLPGEREIGKKSNGLSKHLLTPVPVCSQVMGQLRWMSYRITRS